MALVSCGFTYTLILRTSGAAVLHASEKFARIRKVAVGDLRVDLVKDLSQDPRAQQREAATHYRIHINMKYHPVLSGCVFFWVFMMVLGVSKHSHTMQNVQMMAINFLV